MWRLGPAGSAGEPPGVLAVVFMPSLSSLLLASESKAGRRLTRTEVEGITASATCVTMQHHDAQELERSRGYADLDPRKVGEEWQIVREWT